MSNRSQATNHAWVCPVDWPEGAEARIYDLAQPLAPGIPHHPFHPPFAFVLTKGHGEIVSQGGVSGASDLITLGGHAGTHIDARNHVSRDGKIFGGHVVAELQSYRRGIEAESIDVLPPLIGRGHLIDVPRLLRRDLTPDDTIGDGELAEWFAHRQVPAEGSIVLIRTGWGAYWSDNRRFLGHDSGAPGLTLAGAKWLTERRVVAIGSDTMALEKMPNPELEVHVHCLVEAGVPLMECMYLESLAADHVDDFFFLAVPLKVVGGTGSPIRPIAVVA